MIQPREYENAAHVLKGFEPSVQGSSIHQVYRHVRKTIASGKLKPGDRLPPTDSLASMWAMPVASVHKGLRLLTKEGYLVRRHRLGTFVSSPTPMLRNIACYFPGQRMSNPGGFYASVYQAIETVSSELDLQCLLMVDSRAREAQSEPWPEMTLRTELGQIDGVVSAAADYSQIRWLEQLAVPVAYLSSARTKQSVYFDLNGFARKAVGLLAGNGCRKIGVISACMWHHLRSQGLLNRDRISFSAGLRAEQRRRKIEWLLADQDPVGTSRSTHPADHAMLGYSLTRSLLTEQPDIDGMLVYPDTVAQGAICALLERKALSPLPRLVFHRNREYPVFCPLAADWLESSAEDVARALLAKVRHSEADGGKRIRLIEFNHVREEEGNICKRSNKGGTS